MQAILFVGICLALVSLTVGQVTWNNKEPDTDYDCDGPKELPDQISFPNIYQRLNSFGPLPAGYEITFELNKRTADGKTGSSQYSTERVNTAQRTGYIELQYSNEKDRAKEEIYYFQPMRGTRESFTIKSTQCVVNTQANVLNAYDRTAWFPKALLEQGFITQIGFWQSLGPSTIFMKAFYARNRMKYVGQVGLRGYERVNVWKLCLPRQDGKKSILKYYFLDSSYREGQRPMRIEVFTEGEETWVYTVGTFKQLPSVSTPVPIGFGCQRLILTRPGMSPKPFLDQDFRLEMEIIMETLDNSKLNDWSTAAVYNAEIVHSINHDMMSFTQTMMNVAELESTNPNAIRYQRRKVIDMDEGLQFETNLETSQCKTSHLFSAVDAKKKSPWEMLPEFEFADKSGFKIMDPDLWFAGDFLKFMGIGTERGLPVTIWESVFEDKFEDVDGKSRTIVVTRMYLLNGTRFDSTYLNEGSPVKTVIKIRSEDRSTFERQITMNIHSFNVDVLDVKKEKVFDIQNCFDQPHQSTWFQLMFPTTELAELELMESTPKLEAEIRNVLLGDISPARLPSVIIDFEENRIITTIRLLERSPYTMTFDKQDGKQIESSDADYVSTFMVDTPDDCARSCSVDDECTAFSWCNSLECTIFVQEPGTQEKPVPTKDNNACTTHKRKTTVAAGDRLTLNRMVNEAIFVELQSKIDQHDLKVDIPLETDEDGKVTLEAAELNTDVEPGWFTREVYRGNIDKDDAIAQSLNNFVIKKKNTKKGGDKFTTQLGLGLRSCASMCDDDTECEAFSMCNKHDGECVFSKIGGAALKEDMMDSDNFCTVLQKSALSKFDIYPGFVLSSKAKLVTMVNTVDDCSKICTGEKGFNCRSFDYCLADTEGQVADYCMMHEYHLSASANERLRENEYGVDMKFNSSRTQCMHYSKKYTSEYKESRKLKLADSVPLAFESREISREMCAHHCSEIAGDDCQAFAYCESVGPGKRLERSCKLTTVNEVDMIADTTCSVFIKDLSSADTVSGGGGSAKEGSAKEGSSGGTITKTKFASPALATVMALIFVGCGTAVGYYVYKHKFANTV